MINFYLVAFTGSGLQEKIKIRLIKKSCEFETLRTLGITNITKEYNEDSNFNLKVQDYAVEFSSSN